MIKRYMAHVVAVNQVQHAVLIGAIGTTLLDRIDLRAMLSNDIGSAVMRVLRRENSTCAIRWPVLAEGGCAALHWNKQHLVMKVSLLKIPKLPTTKNRVEGPTVSKDVVFFDNPNFDVTEQSLQEPLCRLSP
jgi:hypothetical protein